jgi:hypothetical protein
MPLSFGKGVMTSLGPNALVRAFFMVHTVTGYAQPTADEVRGALNRIIASDPLRRSAQLVAFLRFVVEAKLRGDGHLIKEYAIAVDALRRSANFNPNADPIVRVEAGRLRRALKGYYAGVGAVDLVLIEIPLGHYVPEFRYRQIATETRRKSLTESFRGWRNSLSKYISGRR